MKVLAVCLGVSLFGLVAAQYNYKDYLSKSILFYEAEETGRLVGNRISWRGDSFTDDGTTVGKDLSGGFFDAGDHVKFGLPLGHTLLYLAWGMYEFRDGYVNSGELQNGLRSLRWGTDWLIKAVDLNNGQVDRIWGQVGQGGPDHDYWGRPEDWPNGPRPAYAVNRGQPGSDLAGSYAAALAAASMAFRQDDASYSATLLTYARAVFEFAKVSRGLYTGAIGDAGGFYPSSAEDDEFTIAAAFLAYATNEDYFKGEAVGSWDYHNYGAKFDIFSDWNSKVFSSGLLLGRVMGEQRFRDRASAHCDHWLYSQQKTPGGLVYINDWGSLRHAANSAFGCLLAAKYGIGNANEYRNFAKRQIDYALGSNPQGRSYVVGMGNNPPQKCHHRAASCPNRPAPCGYNELQSGAPNPQILIGALVGGPGANDNFDDRRDNYMQNEVTLDYNAGYQSALAGLVSWLG